jgi:hypothetical protein
MPMPREVVAVLGSAAAAAVIAAAVLGDGQPRPESHAPAPPPAGPVIGEDAHPGGATAAAEPAAARLIAQRFLAGYLRFLYGRGRARDIPHVSSTVRRGLARARVRVTPAQRDRRAEVVDLELVAQGRRELIATARVADGGVASYPLTFTMARRGGRWLVNSLGSD